MVKIDAHHHLWNYAPETHGWIDESMTVLKRDFTPVDLKVALDTIHFDGCVAVQASQTEAETEFLLNQAEKYPIIKGVVGWLDLCHPDIEERLRYFSQFDKLKGLRHVVQDEPDDRFLLREEFLRGMSLLFRYDLTYDILIFPRHLDVAVEFVSMFPEQGFVLDHIAKPYIKNGSLSPWQEGIKQLADFDNVHCKLSGMVTEADWQSWEYEDFVPYLDIVYDAFGEDRLMIGSDWPVCTLAGDYSQVMGIVLKYLEGKGENAQKKILGQNATDFYHL